jgi:hypothetical protein
MGRCVYRARNQESGEEIEKGVEESAHDGSQDEVGSDGHHHHAVECVEEQADEQDVIIPEELGCCPLELQHGVCDEPIYGGLHQHVWNSINTWFHVSQTDKLALLSQRKSCSQIGKLMM